jgi:bifunctional DNA-binding transcriptional regulator/antitoxin component of YhaV-PrlF toxin-antitoxin module
MTAIVEADSKGRVLLPIEMRRKLRAKRFKITDMGGHLELEPLADPRVLRAKYKDKITGEWDELEEKGEEYVSTGKR